MLQGCGGGGGDSPSGPTTTTTTAVPTLPPCTPDSKTGLCWCEEVQSFYKVSYVNSTKNAGGQCLPSSTPGAYYTSAAHPGDVAKVDPKDDPTWSCWNTETIGRDKAAARARNYEGACQFKDYDSKTTPGDVPDCDTKMDHHPANCAPGPTAFWGACYSQKSENWKCIPKGDPLVEGYAQGNCKAEVVLKPQSSVPEPFFFSGVCRFLPEHPKVYKCDTVPGYNANEASCCGQKVDETDDQACFSVTPGNVWTCSTTKPTTPCDWTVTTNKMFYKGYCVFPQNSAYKTALDASNLTANEYTGPTKGVIV